MKITETEKSDWLINKKELPRKRKRKGNCKICHKRLSKYNRSQYCLSAHSTRHSMEKYKEDEYQRCIVEVKRNREYQKKHKK